MGKYLDILRRLESGPYDRNDINDQSPHLDLTFGRLGRFGRTFEALEQRCPQGVDAPRWRQTIEDGRQFLGRWGKQADALGWTPRNLFGLQDIPEQPHPSYRRLSRYDETGLVWLLQGRTVVAITADTAAIQNPMGAITVYRKLNKPALGPLGDSLDDFIG